MSWGYVAMGIGTVASTALSSDSASDGTNKALKGKAAELDFQQKGLDQARDDQASSRDAGNKALDALMSMTGLGKTDYASWEGDREAQDKIVGADDYLSNFSGGLGATGQRNVSNYMALNPYEQGVTDDAEYISNWKASMSKQGNKKWNAFENKTPVPFGRADGGNIGPDRSQPVGMAGPQTMQNNVNEQGPENIYQGGTVTRGGQPQTIEPNQDGYVQPNENPGGVDGGYNFQTDPGYAFRFNEGMRGLERGAAARGGVLSGGMGRKAVRYGQDYASNEYSNVYNRIAGIAGIGQTANNASGGYAANGGMAMGGTAGDAGAISGYGAIAQGNNFANGVNQMGQAVGGYLQSRQPKTNNGDGGWTQG